MYLFSKMRSTLSNYAQALFVLIAFALMVISSYFFVSNTERNHLIRDAENAILFTEANVMSEMLEPETLLGGVSETIRLIIMHGESKDTVIDFFRFINDYVQYSGEEHLTGVVGFYGFFDVFDGEFLTGLDNWTPPDDFDPQSRPWYSGAVKAAGAVSVTDPYTSTYTGETAVTFSRRIFDRDGNALGVIAFEIMLDRILQKVVNTRFAGDGYGFLLNESFGVIAHPNPDFIGKSHREVNSGIASLMDDFMQTGIITEVTTTDYRGVVSIVFIQKLNNGWYMGVVTPKENYYRSTRSLAMILTSFGGIFAIFLIGILIKINKEKASTDERMKIMFNANPVGTTLFDKDFKVIDCNENVIKMFELSGKEEYIEKFMELSPVRQPDGSFSKDKAGNLLHKTLQDGSTHSEWMHQKLNGELIPCELNLVRIEYMNEYSVVSYTRDMRETKQLIKVSRQQTLLLDTVNKAAAILLANNDMEYFETSLLKCFNLIGHCLDVDRVQIWRNEVLTGETHFVLRYEWLSDFGQTCRSLPVGSHFPYTIRREWEKQFLRNENINAPLSTLPKEDQDFLGLFKMKSIVIIPLFLDGHFWGLFSIDDCRNERTFSEKEISILTSAGLMMSSAVNRNLQSLKMSEAEERTQIMIDTAPLCSIFWDKDLNLIDCNQEAVNMFGLSGKQEFIDNFTSFSPVYQPDGILSTEKGGMLVRKALEEGFSRFEWMHQKPNGEPIPADVTCVRVKYKDEFTVTEYIRDLREQKAMMAEMRKAEIAEESSKAKSDFLAKMSHEIRTPMNAILGITEIQLQDDSHPHVTREAFERIYSSGDLLLGIINDILDLSRIESGKFILTPAQYNIASLIHDAVQINILRYESKPVDFVLDVMEDVPLVFIGDELRIKQVLNNILSNAFKYTHEGTVNLTVYAEPADEKLPAENSSLKTLVFIISDTGQGMTLDQVNKLGTEYSRFNLEANRNTEGTGLGMNITQNLVQLMNGKISIESTPGMGTVFTVRLPQESVGSSIVGKGLADNLMQLNLDNTSKIRNMQMKRDFMPYGRVLVVDDVETNLYVAKGLMAPYGLSIDTSTSGIDAIEKIRNGSVYDIVFMDHMMPKMDGIEATKIIRNLGYSEPVVALTANALAGQAEIFMEYGFDEFISKPIDIRQLNLVLNKLIRDKQPPEVIEAARQQKNKAYHGDKKKKVIDSQLAEYFIRDARSAIPVFEALYLNKCRRADDVSTFIVNVHAMKSALANIGEMNLSAEASKLEQAGREQNTRLILTDLPAFLEMLYTVVEKLEQNDEINGEIFKADDKLYLQEKYLAVKEACVSYDKKIAKKLLEEIKTKQWPHFVKKQLSTISGYLLHSEFDEAANVIDVYLKQLATEFPAQL